MKKLTRLSLLTPLLLLPLLPADAAPPTDEEYNLTPIMTSLSAPSGVVAASSEFGGGYYAYKAFDKYKNKYTSGTSFNVNTWLSNAATGWLSYDFQNNENVVTRYEITPRSNTAIQAPKNWTFEGSNNGSTWDILDTRTNSTGWAAVNGTRSFDVANTTAYRMYRINITAINGASNVGIEEFELFGHNMGSTPVPTGFQLTPGNKKIDLSWDASSDPSVTNFKVYKDGVLVATLPSTTLTYSMTGLRNSTSYRLAVTAVGAGGVESAKITTTAATPTDSSGIVLGKLPTTYSNASDLNFVTDNDSSTFKSLSNGHYLEWTLPSPTSIHSYAATIVGTDAHLFLYDAGGTLLYQDSLGYTMTDTGNTTINLKNDVTNVSRIRYLWTGSGSHNLFNLDFYPVPDSIPPAEVTGVSATTTGTTIQLNFTTPTDSDYSHKNIYRWNPGTSNWDLISTP